MLLAACGHAPVLPAAPAFNALYAFGDSLTDTGNNPAEPVLHYQGRWSNGPLWVEYLSARLGFAYNPSNNLAISGAQADDTYRQVTNFVPHADVSQALFVVWAGGNDFLQEYDTYWFDDVGWDQHIAYAVGNLSNAVVNLQGKGARFILVPNTVDVTKIPVLNSLPGVLLDYLRGKVKEFNSELDAALTALQTDRPALTLYRCDGFANVKALLKDAKSYGFTETSQDALSDVTLLDKSFDGPGAQYVFWDPIHPTTKVHAIVADWFQVAVAPMTPRLTLKPGATQLRLGLSQVHVTQNYTLQESSNLTTWSDLQTYLCVTTNQTLDVTNIPPRSFFRLKWMP
jgi:phospholipase/lecithinase/hemolysin